MKGAIFFYLGAIILRGTGRYTTEYSVTPLGSPFKHRAQSLLSLKRGVMVIVTPAGIEPAAN